MSEDLIKLLPRIKRGREFYLYDEKGNRYLDLYLDNGRAICGHRPNGLSNVLKNAISRGIYAPYPSVYDDRLLKVLKKGFPAFKNFGIYNSLESFQIAYNKQNGKDAVFTDPLTQTGKTNATLWRPYLPIPEQTDMLLIKLPYPGIEVIAVASKNSRLPSSRLPSPVTTAGLVRSWYDLQDRITNRDEKNWPSLDNTNHWTRKGPWLTPKCQPQEYGSLFRLYLKNGILISPYFDIPSFCAVDIKEGTLKKLMRSLKEEKGDK